MIPSFPGNNRFRMWMSVLCNSLVWGLVLRWYVLDSPGWISMLQEAKGVPSAVLKVFIRGHPMVGVCLGTGIWLLSLVFSLGKSTKTFVNIQAYSAMLAAAVLIAFVWGFTRRSNPWGCFIKNKAVTAQQEGLTFQNG